MASTSTDYRPTNGHSRLPDAFDRLFQDVFAEPVPRKRPAERAEGIPCNLVETWANYVLQVALPGIDPEQLEVQVVARQVIIHGKYSIPPVENGTYLWQGIDAGEFSEVFTMPAEVDGDNAQAHYEKGILSVRMPKIEYLKAKYIKVQTAE